MLGDLFNIILGLCGIAYSFIPADRVKNYNRTLALIMRLGGILLCFLGITNWLLRFLSKAS